MFTKANGTRVALVQCRMRDILMDYRFQSENVGIGMLAAVLRQQPNIEVDILDAHLNLWTLEELLERLTSVDYDVIGFSCSAQESAMQTFFAIDQLRRRGVDAHITLGGHYATFDCRTILANAPGADSVVMSEGELTFVDLVTSLRANAGIAGMAGVACRGPEGVVLGPPRAQIENLDSLPFAARDDFNVVMERNIRSALTASRGCYANCSFCTIPSFYGNRIRRRRSAENVVAEIVSLYERGARKMRFNDDIFIDRSRASRAWVLEICERILDGGMRDLNLWIEARACDFTPDVVEPMVRAGLRKVFIGVESASQTQLDRYNKQLAASDNSNAVQLLKDYGIPEVTVGFIMFDPDTTLEDIEINLEFLRAIGQYHSGNLFSRLIIYKGAPIFEELEASGILIFDDWISVPDYRFADPRVQTLHHLVGEIREYVNPMVRVDFTLDIVDRRFQGQLARGKADDPAALRHSEELRLLAKEFNHKLAETVLEAFSEATRRAATPEVNLQDFRRWTSRLFESHLSQIVIEVTQMLDSIADRHGIRFAFEVEEADGQRLMTTWDKGFQPSYAERTFEATTTGRWHGTEVKVGVGLARHGR